MYKIGVIARPDKTSVGNAVWMIHEDIRKAILSFEGLPVILIPTNLQYQNEMLEKDFLKLEPLLKECDGFIFQGGDDFYPFDFSIVHYAYQNNIPSLGICLGMQTMSVLFDGALEKIQDTTFNHLQRKKEYVHLVTVNPYSKFYEMIKQDQIKVNSRHQECVKTTKLSIVGMSSDHVIEAVESKEKDFFIGVQWHPESMLEYDTVSKTLFTKFFDAVGRYHENRKISGHFKGDVIKENKK